MIMTIEVARYRVGMAELLNELVRVVGKTEQWLDVAVNGDKVSLQAVVEKDLAGAYRVYCALLLHKAGLHMVAMLRANERSNVHSLAVQMRPILECAGQVVHIFHNLMIEAKKEFGIRAVLEYVNADFYDTVIRQTKGDISQEQLLKTISEAAMISATNVHGFRRLTQTNKVAKLQGGEAWYKYLSKHFCHGETDWRGVSSKGGVGSIGPRDDFTFAGFMDYLVEQVAVMNLYAALCPVDGVMADGRIEAAQAHLQQVRATSRSLRDGAVSAIVNLNKRGHDQ